MGSLTAKAAGAETAIATTIKAATINNKSVRLNMRYLLHSRD
jgi:hypothetical protein